MISILAIVAVLGLNGAWFAPHALAATTLTFAAEADARVAEAAPATNYGSSTALRTDGGSDPDVESYLRFTVANISGVVQSARLRVYASSATTDGPAVYATSSTWSETGISWSNRPARVGGVIADKTAVQANSWVEYDVTPLIVGNGAYAFILATNSADGIDFSAREAGSNKPQLVLIVDNGVAPPSPTPTVVPGSGPTYYVDSVTGNDSNSGTSEAAAWKTLGKANTAALEPGGRLLFKRGGSWTGSLKITTSGTSSIPISVGAYGAGELPIISGASSCVVLSGSYLALQELHVDACSWAGVEVSGSYNRVTKNVITHNAAGIYIRSGATNNRILANQITDHNRMSVLTPTPTNDDAGAFGVLLRGDYTEIAYNTISGSDAFSYDYGRDGAAIEVYGGQNNTIHHNLAIENDAFTELGNSRSADNTYAYNVVRSSLPSSVFLVTRGAKSSYGPILRTHVYNNSVLLTGSSSQGFVCHAGCGGTILTMRNNIVWAAWKVGYADAPFDEDYDLFYGGATQFVRGSHSLVTNPGLIDPAVGDMHLQPSSPAIDHGVDLAYTQDFDGRAVAIDGDRNNQIAPDIGAFEYQ
jgi:parallel beta-helix repeat protein